MYFLHVNRPVFNALFFDRMYDVENKSFFVLFIHMYFNVIWQMLIFFSVTDFFGFAYKHPTLLITQTSEFPIVDVLEI